MSRPDRDARRWAALLRRALAWSALLAAGAAPCADGVQTMRDPMLPPAALHLPLHGDAALVPAAEPIAVRHLLLIGGRRYVVDAGQRYAVGDTLGGARIERIDDTSVWLRQADGLRQVSLYGGIVKRAAVEPAAAAAAPTLAGRDQRERAALNRSDENNLNR
jgi:hypothetical protein